MIVVRFLFFWFFVQAVAEIAKASKREAGELLNQAELYKKDVNSKKMIEEKRAGKKLGDSGSHANENEDIENVDFCEYFPYKEFDIM